MVVIIIIVSIVLMMTMMFQQRTASPTDYCCRAKTISFSRQGTPTLTVPAKGVQHQIYKWARLLIIRFYGAHVRLTTALTKDRTDKRPLRQSKYTCRVGGFGERQKGCTFDLPYVGILSWVYQEYLGRGFRMIFQSQEHALQAQTPTLESLS